MKKCSRTLVFLIAFLVLSGIPSLQAQWVDDGSAVCTNTMDQRYHQMVSDGSGGAIVTWKDSRNGNDDIYAQRMDVSGNAQWATDGVAISAATSIQGSAQITSDGSGGAIITWMDYRNGNYDIYAQRIDAYGNVLWMVDGVAVCAAAGEQKYPQIVSDGFGGAIIAWEDGEIETEIYAQRIDAAGDSVWVGRGVAVCTAQQGQDKIQMISDGSGGAIIAWEDLRPVHTLDIYAQRVDAGGGTLWITDGVPICTAVGNQMNPRIAADGSGGAIISWTDKRSGSEYDIYAQRIDAWGSVQWTADGVPICTAAGSQLACRIISDGLSGALVAWEDSRGSDGDIYAQRINGSGTVQWASNGVAICAASGSQSGIDMTSDGASGAIITWVDYRSDSDIYAQRVSAAGSAKWITNGVAVCEHPFDKDEARITWDGTGGAIISWIDWRNGSCDVYAGRVARNGICYPPAPRITSVEDVPDDQGGKISLQWEKSFLDTIPHHDITHYSVWRRLPEVAGAMRLEGCMGSEPVNIPIDFKGPALRLMSGGSAWEWLANVTARYLDTYALTVVSLSDSMGDDPGWQYFRVAAHTEELSGWYDSPVDSGYSVDNLSPSMPLALAGEQSYTPVGLALSWNPNTEADLGCYRIYRGTSEGFVPAPGNLIASPCDTFFFDDGWTWDGRYCYKVSASDVHGNQSPFALLRPEDVTGDEPPAFPSANHLEQNYPNPFNPATTISFGLAERARVSLCIYNAAGRLIRVLVNESREAARYQETWDGLDNGGCAAASGVYFYNLSAGTFNETRKMILMR